MSVIRQTATFSATPRELYDTYMDSARHGRSVGARASIGRRPGSRFWVFAPDAVRGRTLLAVPGRLVVQAWRGQPWREDDLDSILALAFSPAPGGGRVELVQALVPAHAKTIIASGWRDHYWRPWKTHFERR